MFLPISQRLQGQKMGMDSFGMVNVQASTADGLQLVGRVPARSVRSVVNRLLTVAAPFRADARPAECEASNRRHSYRGKADGPIRVERSDGVLAEAPPQPRKATSP